MPTRTRKRTPKGHKNAPQTTRQTAAPAAVVKAVAEAKSQYAGLSAFGATPPPTDAPRAIRLAWLESRAAVLAGGLLKDMANVGQWAVLKDDAAAEIAIARASGNEADLRRALARHAEHVCLLAAVEAPLREAARHVLNGAVELLPALDGKLPNVARLARMAPLDSIDGPDAVAEVESVVGAARRARLGTPAEPHPITCSVPAAADLITCSVAATTYGVGPGTLQRRVKEGVLKDYREASKKRTTSPLILSRLEVERLYPRRKSPQTTGKLRASGDKLAAK
ncbi:MAG TPA: hypothetical protein VM431_15955 [Phycisphaerae bacterium]|nr:hypothetical protein [Phycisphaerae bacterium]